MSKKQAQEIIALAMADQSVYADMARREAEFWGRHLVANTTPEMKERFAVEQDANKELQAKRYDLSMLKLAEEQGRRFENVLILGCGTGRIEQKWYETGCFGHFHGIDIAPQAVECARQHAVEAGLPFTYEVADLNFHELPGNTYDLVVAVTVLHHCLRLEYIAEQIDNTLKPNGELWLHDYIGESQFQYDPERVELLRKIREILPEKYHFNKLNQRPLKPVQPRDLPLPSPFESIRSEEIPAVFKDRFDVVKMTETTGFIHLAAPGGTRSTYAESEDGRALFEMMLLMDRLLVERGLLRPSVGNYIMKSKSKA